MSKRLYLQSGHIVNIFDIPRPPTMVSFYIDIATNNTSSEFVMTTQDARKLADAIIEVLEPGARP